MFQQLRGACQDALQDHPAAQRADDVRGLRGQSVRTCSTSRSVQASACNSAVIPEVIRKQCWKVHVQRVCRNMQLRRTFEWHAKACAHVRCQHSISALITIHIHTCSCIMNDTITLNTLLLLYSQQNAFLTWLFESTCKQVIKQRVVAYA